MTDDQVRIIAAQLESLIEKMGQLARNVRLLTEAIESKPGLPANDKPATIDQP